MKRFFSLLLVVGLMATMLVGCGGGDSDKLQIGVLIYKYDDNYISTVRQALEAEAEDDEEVELLMNDGQGDQATQNDQIDVLIEKGVDALAINIVDIGAAQSAIEKAEEAEIPVVLFNREPEADVIKAYDKAAFVGTQAEEAGIIQGEMMVEEWNEGDYDRNGDDVMQYVMLKGDADDPETVARSEYSIKTLNEAGIETEELGVQVANWDNDKANQAVEAWLDRFGDEIEFVIANNDGMTSGAASALQSAGYNTGEDDEKYIQGIPRSTGSR